MNVERIYAVVEYEVGKGRNDVYGFLMKFERIFDE